MAHWWTGASASGHPDLRPNDIRHVCAVNLVRAGVPPPDVGKWLGHESGSIAVTMKYAKYQPENAAYDAIQKLTDCRNQVEEERASYEAA